MVRHGQREGNQKAEGDHSRQRKLHMQEKRGSKNLACLRNKEDQHACIIGKRLETGRGQIRLLKAIVSNWIFILNATGSP